MKHRYIKIDLLRAEDFRNAEKLHKKGYKSLSGFHSITFEIPVKNKIHQNYDCEVQI